MSKLSEENVNVLDFAEFEQVDLILRGHEWGPIQGKSGIKAYLKTGYFVLVVDELAKKYSQNPIYWHVSYIWFDGRLSI